MNALRLNTAAIGAAIALTLGMASLARSAHAAPDLAAFERGNSHAPTLASQAPDPGVKLAATTGKSGKTLFERTCVACHGANGKGTIPGVPDLTAAGGRLAQPDSVLRMHVLKGFQTPGSAMAMPPKGGNPNLSEADVATLVDYMKSTFKP